MTRCSGALYHGFMIPEQARHLFQEIIVCVLAAEIATLALLLWASIRYPGGKTSDTVGLIFSTGLTTASVAYGFRWSQWEGREPPGVWQCRTELLQSQNHGSDGDNLTLLIRYTMMVVRLCPYLLLTLFYGYYTILLSGIRAASTREQAAINFDRASPLRLLAYTSGIAAIVKATLFPTLALPVVEPFLLVWGVCTIMLPRRYDPASLGLALVVAGWNVIIQHRIRTQQEPSASPAGFLLVMLGALMIFVTRNKAVLVRAGLGINGGAEE